MNRYQQHALSIASLSFGLLAAAPARAAAVTQVTQSTWGASGVPSYVTMYIYVPDKLATKPPIVAAHHSCGTPVSGYVNSISGILAAADKNGFIIILPEATGQNCWDVGTAKSLKHDGGGDTQAVVQMVRYALTKYNGDAARVYAMGGSSGAMMTQALMAVYPDVFKAGSARAGVAAGCWADGYASSNQWSNNCAGGNTTKTAQQWGDLVRSMYAGYTGHRPRIQLFHGTADQTINYRNLAESIKEWTNVLQLPAMPASTDTKTTPVSTYDRQFWQNACGYTVFETWAGKNGSHSMAYEQEAILGFFGLDKADGTDPEPDCSGTGGTGAGGASAGGSGGVSAGGKSAGGSGAGSGGVIGGSGSGGSAGNVAAGGFAVKGGAPGAGGTPNVAGSPSAGAIGTGMGGSTGGSSTSGGASSSSSGGSVATSSGGAPSAGVVGSSGSGNASAGTGTAPEPSGCSFASARDAKSKHGYTAASVMGLALLALRRRRRGAPS